MDPESIFGNAARASVGPEAAVYALAAIGLNLHFGYTGLLNFGVSGYMLVGAYGMAVTTVTWGQSFWLGILVAALVSVGLSFVLGLPTLRLRADYFAITTIAVAEILRIVVRSSPLDDLTGSVFGLQTIANTFFDLNPIPRGRYGWGVLSFPHQQLWVLSITWSLVAVATLVVWLLMRSPWGRVIKSIREDEDATRSLGKNVFGYKMQSLVVGGVIMSMAGMMFAIRSNAANADAYQVEVTFFIYLALILGGAATTFGPILGSVVFWFLFAGLQSALREAAAEDLLPSFLASSEDIGAVTIATVGIVLMLLIVFRPQGILGNRQELILDV